MAKQSSSLLSQSWGEFTHLLQNRWQTYMWYVILRFVIAVVFFAASAALLYGPILEMIGNAEALLDGAFDWMSYVPYLGVFGIFALVTSLVGMVITFGFYRVVLDDKAAQTAGEVWSRGTKNYWMTLLSMIGFGILATLLIGIGFVLLVVPGIYLALGLSFGMFLVIIDHDGPLEAIKHSRALVSGRWWSVFGALLFWGVLSGVVLMIIDVVFKLGLSSVVDFSALESLESGLSADVAQQNFQAALDSVSQMFSLFVNPSTVGIYSIQMLLQSIVGIVPMYGVLAVYKSLRKN
ncbi:MAG: hypothetical protein P1V18_05255 [Candidatus Gracilibacteria bacterium]|nr:hypothetical protein [Candidatus Gracilibacteria bacterium]